MIVELHIEAAGSSPINQNQLRETDMRVPEIQKGVSETDWAASGSGLSRRVWGLPNPFLKRPPG